MNQILDSDPHVLIGEGPSQGLPASLYDRPVAQRLFRISQQRRLSITYDLQESLGPKLASIATKCRAIGVELYLDQNPHEPAMDELVQDIVEINQLLTELIRHYNELDQQKVDLASSLTSLVQRTRKIFGLRCRFRQSGPAPILPADQVPHFYSLISEAVSLAKRRGATSIMVHLETASESVRVEILDNGSLTNESHSESLETLSFQASLLGASLKISTTPDNYCKTLCWINT